MIVYNYGSSPIFISVGVIPDTEGGPGIAETTYLLPPNGNGGIDLSIIKVFTKEEKEKK